MAYEEEELDPTNETEGTEKTNEEEVAETESEETEGGKPEYTENEKKAYARMKKAEADVKELKAKLAQVSKPTEKPAPVGDLQKIVNETLEKRDLESLDLSDSLKKEVSNYAKLMNIPVKKALSSDYISFIKEKEEKIEKINNASLGNSRKPVTRDYGSMKPSDFDLKTPEGRADFAKYEDDLRKKLG